MFKLNEQKGEMSSVELAQSCLDQIAKFDNLFWRKVTWFELINLITID